MSNARRTMESAIITALRKTSGATKLTIDKCDTLVPEVINQLFAPAMRWAIEAYLKEVTDA